MASLVLKKSNHRPYDQSVLCSPSYEGLSEQSSLTALLLQPTTSYWSKLYNLTRKKPLLSSNVLVFLLATNLLL